MTIHARTRSLASRNGWVLLSATLVGLLELGCGGPPAPAATVAAPTTTTALGSTAHPHWGYSEGEGPEHWGDLDPSFASCKTGMAQSPIDLPVSPSRKASAPPRPHWDPVPLHVTNNGHAIQVDDTAASSFVVDGVTYRLAQFHFHSPAEHTIGGRTFEVEMHLVHKSDTGKLLVVGMLFATGAENAILAPVFSVMPGVGEPPAVSGATVDISTLLSKSPRYLRYDGSLTTPPCTEGVVWLVAAPDAGLQMSAEQIKKLRDRTLPKTNRPPQAIGSREVAELVP
jgi:carbonic anhydrase